MMCTEQMATVSNLMSIWYYDDQVSEDVQHQMKIHLHQKFNYSRIFNDLKDFMDYISSRIVVQHIIVIISSQTNATFIQGVFKIRQQRLSRLKQQRLSCYQLQLGNQKTSTFSDPASERSKIKKHFDTIIEDLRKIKCSSESAEDQTSGEELDTDESTLPFGIFKSISAQNSFRYLNKESLKFLLFQSLIEVLVNMPYNQKAFKHMWSLCRKDYREDCIEMEKINTFAQDYTSNKAIYYYTRDSFLFRLINRAFRLDDVDRIFRFGCYIADLYKQLEQLNNAQRSDSSPTLTFYRGKKLSTDVLQQLKDNVGQLISMNGLLSTTENFVTSTTYAGIEGSRNDYQSVVFEMRIHNTTPILTRPYANVSKVSPIEGDNEVLFFMGFVWKIESMEETTPKRWYIVLESCNDYDPELVTYMEHARRSCTFLTVGNILRELGDHANAKNFYRRLLNDKNLAEETRGHVYYNIAMLAEDMGEYMDALEHLQQAEELIKPIAKLNDGVPAPSRPLFAHNIAPSRLDILNNMGRLYYKDGEHETARNYFKAALKELGSEVEIATVLNNYGLLEYECGNFDQAHDYFSLAVQKAKDDACVKEFKYNLDLANNMLLKKGTAAVDANRNTQ